MTAGKLEKEDHPFAQYVRILARGKRGSRSLSEEEAYQAMTMIVKNQVEDIQLGAFLMLLRVKELVEEELVGFVKAVKDNVDFPQNLPQIELDLPCYAGKKKQLPWFLLSANLLSQNGMSIFMHGCSKYLQGRVFLDEIAATIKIPICRNWEEVTDRINTSNFAFLPLEVISPQLHRIITLRYHFGVRSPVHTLVRHLNPTNAKAVIQGVFHPAYLELHQNTAIKLGYQNFAVLKGEGGEPERKPEAKTRMHMLLKGEPKIVEWSAMQAHRQEKLTTLDLEELPKVWRGEVENPYGELAAIGTAAIGLMTTGRVEDTGTAVEIARTLWEKRDRNRWFQG
ncbi:MAG: glycosyl transferase family protein [Pseudomonadales bacterium]|nr:glycosyl transferase family protein [Pseudomonadales bacterium]